MGPMGLMGPIGPISPIRPTDPKASSGGENLLKPLVLLQIADASGRLFEQLLDHCVGRDAFGGGSKVGEDAVPHNRQGESLNVLVRDVFAAIQECTSFAAEDEVLDGSRAGAPAQPLLDELRHARLADARLANESQRVLDDLIRN